MKQAAWILIAIFLFPLACKQREFNTSSDILDSYSSTKEEYGFNKNQTCADYIRSNWYVGASIKETASVSAFLPNGTLTSTVAAVKGSIITINTLVHSMKGDIKDRVTFDACKEGEKTVVLKTMPNCHLKEIGNDTIEVKGEKYKAIKLQSVGECISNVTKDTYSTVVWRVAELPLWGIVRRDLSGSMFTMDISTEASSWSDLKK